MKKPTPLIAIFTLLLIAALFLPLGSAAAQATLTVSVDNAAKSGQPGSAVTYIFTLNNAAAADETVTITTASGSLVSVSAPSSVVVTAAGTANVQVAVNINAAAQGGNSDATTVTFQGSSGQTVPILLTTTVIGLPTTAPTVPAGRPLVVINGYYLDKDSIRTGDTFGLFVTLKNNGSANASNLILSFINDAFLPQETGGVISVGRLDTGQSKDVKQPFLVSSSLAGQPVGIVPLKLTYTDSNGVVYTEAFSITLQLQVYYGPIKPTATPTPANVYRPQLVVSAYRSSVEVLQPGTQFAMDLEVNNLGNSDARGVTMIIGGGAPPTDPNGTPSPGGVSGGSGDLATFAPVGSSNLVFLGDLASGAKTLTKSNLIVNVSANPGAYTLKLSFVYTDVKGNRLVDDQLITLLIYQLPMLETSFYRDPGMIFSGQPNVLPLQIVNLGRKSTVLGNMTVSAAGAEVQNNISLVGPLDPGGSFTLDTTLIPQQPGDLDVQVLINYTDDFNQPRQITQVVKVKVQEGGSSGPTGPGNPEKPGVIGPGDSGAPGGLPVVEETTWQKVLRAIKGFFGLDSAPPSTTGPAGIPSKEGPQVPSGGSSQPIVAPPVKGP